MVNKKQVGAIIQARYDSTRLPGKVLMSLPFASGTTILEHIVNRLKLVKGINNIIIATSDKENDLPIVREAQKIGVDFFRGSKDDVLDRFCKTAEKFELDQVIRLTGDNPLVLIDFLEDGIKEHVENNFDYTTNDGLPYGTSFEIVTVDALKRIKFANPTQDESEHVTLFIKRNREKFKIRERKFPANEVLKETRLTIDYPSDYALMNILMQMLEKNNLHYSLSDLYQLFNTNPWLLDINKDNMQKRQYNSFREEYKDVAEVLSKFSFTHTLAILQKTRKEEATED